VTPGQVAPGGPPVEPGQPALPPGAANQATAQQHFEAMQNHANQIIGRAPQYQNQQMYNQTRVYTNSQGSYFTNSQLPVFTN